MRVYLIIFFLSIITLSCEQSIEQKVNQAYTIDNKYSNTKLRTSRNIVNAPQVIEVYLDYLKTIKGKDVVPDVQRIRDSLYMVLIKRNNIDIENLKKDTSEVNKLLESFYYYSDYDTQKLKKDIYSAFGNDLERSYEDVLLYIENGYFENGVSKEQVQESLSKLSKPTAQDVEKWMSSWNGSIKDFNIKVKQLLDDPDSFEHIETSYSLKNNPPVVRLKFRCKNKYNATVTNTAEGILNLKTGEVSELKILN